MLFGCCIIDVKDIENLKEIGYDYYEFSGEALVKMEETDFKKVLEITEKTNLPCIGLNRYSSGVPAMIGPGFVESDSQKYAEIMCRRGAALGIKAIGIGAPKARTIPENYDRKMADEEFKRFIEINEKEAIKYGITLLLEPIHSHACNYLNTTQECVEMINSLNTDGLNIVLDFYHMLVEKETFESVDYAKPYLKHTHISTCGDGFLRGFPQMDEIDYYVSILKKLNAIGYNQAMSIEPNEFDYEKAKGSLAMLREARGRV